MELCSSGHEEIVHTGRGDCPLCTVTDRLNDASNEVEAAFLKLTKEITKIRATIAAVGVNGVVAVDWLQERENVLKEVTKSLDAIRWESD